MFEILYGSKEPLIKNWKEESKEKRNALIKEFKEKEKKAEESFKKKLNVERLKKQIQEEILEQTEKIKLESDIEILKKREKEKTKVIDDILDDVWSYLIKQKEKRTERYKHSIKKLIEETVEEIEEKEIFVQPAKTDFLSQSFLNKVTKSKKLILVEEGNFLAGVKIFNKNKTKVKDSSYENRIEKFFDKICEKVFSEIWGKSQK